MLCCAAGGAYAKCAIDHVDLRWDGGSVRFDVEIADTPELRAKGLMFRESMGRYKGMLFDYKLPVTANFWMENTLISLDMIFLDKQGVVRKIHANAEPLSRATIRGGSEILAVLEINGGVAARLGIKEGAQMKHPAFASFSPKWPCE